MCRQCHWRTISISNETQINEYFLNRTRNINNNVPGGLPIAPSWKHISDTKPFNAYCTVIASSKFNDISFNLWSKIEVLFIQLLFLKSTYNHSAAWYTFSAWRSLLRFFQVFFILRAIVIILKRKHFFSWVHCIVQILIKYFFPL